MSKMHSRNPLHYAVAAAVLVSVLACGPLGAKATETPLSAPTNTARSATATPQPTATTDAAYASAQSYAGHWEGEWHNLTFSSQGTLQLDVTVKPDGTASFTVDVGGMAFGVIDPEPVTYAGTYTGKGLRILVEQDPLFGRLEVFINADGSLTATSEQIPISGIKSMTVNGTATATEMNLEYTVQLSAGQADGEVELTRKSP